MKYFIAVTLLLGASLAQAGPLRDGEIQTWDDFKIAFGKVYSTAEEEAARKATFEANLKFIAENAGNGIELGVNAFSDMSDDEFFAKNANLANHSAVFESIPLADQSQFYETLPAHWDWREKIHWNPIENQGHCGSCWAFATVQAVEAAYAIRHHKNVHLSKQELVDCTLNSYDHSYMNQGCKMGYTTEANKYMVNHGVYEEHFYPYRGVNDACHLNKMATHQRYRINSYQRLVFAGPDSAMMAALHAHGPIVVNINDHDAIFKHYRSGVIRNLMPNIKQTTHSVVLVGWGTEHGVDYWVIRNSWGAQWGDHGYAKIERHHNLMGINDYPIFPILH